MAEMRLKDWQVPAFEELPQRRMGWVTEQVQEGSQWWQSQNTTQYADQYAKLLGASAGGGKRLRSNNLKSDLRKFIETFADVKEIATYGTGAEQFKTIVSMYNQITGHIYRESHFPIADRKCLQWAVVANRGYMWPRYKRDNYGWGNGRVVFQDLAGPEVMPSQVPSDHDIQGCYAITIAETLGIAEAHARYPKFQDQLFPIAKTRPLNNNHVRRLESWDRMRFADQQDWDRRYCEIHWTFVRDLRINTTGQTLKMGDENTTWYYEVPSLKSLMVTTNPQNNLPQSRFAMPEDCRVYPQLRLIITNPGMSVPMYDGPAFDWHGMMPAVPYDVDDWPWLAVGYSLIQDIAGIETTQREFIDLMWRVLKIRLNPPLGYDLDAGIPREDIKRFNILDEEGTHLGVSGRPAAALESLLPESVQVTAQDFQLYSILNDMRSKALGLNDLASMEKLKFNLSSENVDKILETLGPVAKGIAANLDKAHSTIATMLKYMIPQYYSTRRLMSYIGPEAIALTVFDSTPDQVIPSHLPQEQEMQKAGTPSNYTQFQRAKWFADNLSIVSVPSQLLDITAMQEQLKYLNFLQRGLPISFETCFKKLGVDNWGESVGTTEFEKWQWEQRQMALAKIDAMKAVAGDMPPGVGAPPPTPGGASPGGSNGHQVGRPPTSQAPPKLETRGSETGNYRTVVSQSK